MTLSIRPITQRAARAWVAATHRHLGAPRGDVIRVALYDDDRLIGVAMAGRPSARSLDDGGTLEIVRVAIAEGEQRGGCSMCYGALRRAASALGWRRMITYTLPEEGGASLRGAGFRLDGEAGGGEWDRNGRPRPPAARPDPKLRWVWP